MDGVPTPLLMEKLLSVILPVYNTEIYFRDCLESLLPQLDARAEVIIMDDGCTDGCPKIMEEFLLTGVKTIKQEPVDDGLTRVYDMQGRLVHTAPTATFNLWKVPARGVLVVKQGNTVRKVAR